MLISAIAVGLSAQARATKWVSSTAVSGFYALAFGVGLCMLKYLSTRTCTDLLL